MKNTQFGPGASLTACSESELTVHTKVHVAVFVCEHWCAESRRSRSSRRDGWSKFSDLETDGSGLLPATNGRDARAASLP